MTFKHIKNPDPISKEERYEMAMEEWNHIYGSSNLKKPTRDITQEEVNNALDKVASEILNPANKCGLSINGKCTGNFSPLDCDGLDKPEECFYNHGNTPKTSEENKDGK